MIRRSNQKVKSFILELRIQATKCNFGYRLKTQLHDRLIADINMLNLEKELIQKPKVLFQEARTTCNNHEALHEFDFQSVKISVTFLSCRDELKCQTHEVVNNVVDKSVDLNVHGSDDVAHDQKLIVLLHCLIERNNNEKLDKCPFRVSKFERIEYLI
ncbi:unnamed protein product [Schistosoma mattheei]|uniref:Uncharacterized protein n=1 Tax=Schistosoma mattheei TaxID=31246 RepID=A0A183P4Z9_9TREM|nr:unnamed protein product [Schistosoma mattheei]